MTKTIVSIPTRLAPGNPDQFDHAVRDTHGIQNRRLDPSDHSARIIMPPA